jgi:hypothetical protein
MNAPIDDGPDSESAPDDNGNVPGPPTEAKGAKKWRPAGRNRKID